MGGQRVTDGKLADQRVLPMAAERNQATEPAPDHHCGI
jgi:hypothetical protein